MKKFIPVIALTLTILYVISGPILETKWNYRNMEETTKELKAEQEYCKKLYEEQMNK